VQWDGYQEQRPTLIKRIGVCGAFSSEGGVLGGCACCRVVGHSYERAGQHLRCDEALDGVVRCDREKSRGAGAESDCAIAIRMNEGIAAVWWAGAGGDEGMRWVG
jgi:hypothetical protein